MNYSCMKTGFEPLDSIHAIGLGLLLWGASKQPVIVEDRGLFHMITTEAPIEPINLATILADLLPLATVAGLEADIQCAERATYVLEGALAWLLTSPGVRAVSVASMRRRSFRNPNIAEAAISKCSRLLDRALSLAQRINKRLGTSADRMLAGYAADDPQPIFFGPKPSGGLSIPLVLEPALGYAYRHQLADGDIADKTNVAAISPLIAPLLLLLGSIYCIRSQEVAGGLVHIYAPIVRQAIISGAPVLPCFPATDASSDEALMGMWLKAGFGQLFCQGNWERLAYQILQTQGAQQSISLERGTLNLSRQSLSPTQLELCRRWARWLTMPRAQRPPGTDDLISAMLRREPSALNTHIRMSALVRPGTNQPQWPIYTEDEIREVIVMSNATDAISTSLVEIMNRPQGTYRFGTALRGLGEYLPAVQRDLSADLDVVRDYDQLQRVLARIAEQCTISSAKNPFAVVPNDDDLRGLMADVDQHGARTIAGLIIILAALRYPRRAVDLDASAESGKAMSEAA